MSLEWMKDRQTDRKKKERKTEPVGVSFSGSKGPEADGLSCGGRGGENQAFELAFLTVKYCVGGAGRLAVGPPLCAAPGTRWDTEAPVWESFF